MHGHHNTAGLRRPAGPLRGGDSRELYDRREGFRPDCPTNGAFIKTERLAADLDKGNRMYGLYAAGEMVGFMQIEQGRDGAFILEKLAVLPDSRHFGYGKMLLDFAVQTSRKLGGNKLLAAIIEENAVLKQWYLDNGFIHTGTRQFPHLPFTVGFLEAAI